MKSSMIVFLFLETDQSVKYGIMSLFCVMLLFLVLVIYIFSKKYSRDEVRAPLDDDNEDKFIDKE